eukprot:SAG22_NODE_1848_length_3446_cov_4.797132_5_plen_83_part_00
MLVAAARQGNVSLTNINATRVKVTASCSPLAYKNELRQRYGCTGDGDVSITNLNLSTMEQVSEDEGTACMPAFLLCFHCLSI